jgi:hypothetical protein
VKRPYIPRGCDQQGRLLTQRQMEQVAAGRPLGELLLSSGAVEGPFRRTRPITRWRRACRRTLRALLAFWLAPRADLSTKD